MAISVGPPPTVPSMGETVLRAKRVDVQPAPWPGPIQLTARFTALKENLTSGNESAIRSSFQRLLRALSEEIDLVSALGSQAVPAISLTDTADPLQADHFLRGLRQRGVGIIRGVVPRDTALAWGREVHEYASQDAQHAQPQDVYWSPAQVKARVHPNILAAQRFVMSIWKSSDARARVTTDFPITYADRVGAREAGSFEASPCAHVDGGSVERWEPDGYGRAGTYENIFRGRWEDYDPWESSTRLGVTSDLYHRASACSIFRMFQGWLALDPIPPGPGSVRVCPLPRLATAYFLLRPFFSPSASKSASGPEDKDKDKEWTLDRPHNSILHGALPSYAQEISPALHPHLDLDRSLVPVPRLEPGDYLVWHPDLIHTISFDTTATNANPNSASTPNTTPSNGSSYTYMYLPACPLTQTNALYLARQRKAFLAGCPGPDFGGGRGEGGHAGRAGVQEVNDAGGDDGLRAMGLLPWDEEEADDDETREVLAMANGILFPDLYDML